MQSPSPSDERWIALRQVGHASVPTGVGKAWIACAPGHRLELKGKSLRKLPAAKHAGFCLPSKTDRKSQNLHMAIH